MSSATQSIGRGGAPAALPFVIGAVVIAAALLALSAWRSTNSEARGASSIPTLELGTQGDSMVFDRTELTVRTGTMTKVVFHNNSRLSDMDHNWILVQSGAEQTSAAAGIAAGKEQDFVSPNDPNVIAFTKLAGRGKSSSVEFVAPPPGRYPYFCGFPGHQMVMKGTLVVTQ